jgi:hypothetical protein
VSLLKKDIGGYRKQCRARRVDKRWKSKLAALASKYLAPEFLPGRLTEMNCFDPNRCSCLRYAGRERIPGGWRLTHQSADLLACRERPQCGLEALRAFRSKEGSNQDRGNRTESHYGKV